MRTGEEKRLSAIGIGLLDATGLGLGHFALRRRSGILLVFGTLAGGLVGLVLPRFVGLMVLAVWLVVSGIFGYRAGRVVEPHDGVGHTRSFIAFGIAALVAVAIGYWQYTSAANRAYASALAAHRHGNCTHALDLYGRLDRLYKFSYRSFTGVNAKKRDCRALIQVDRLIKIQRFDLAIAGYKHFQLEHPTTLVEHAAIEARQASAYAAWGDWRLQLSRAKGDPNLLAAAAQSYDLAERHEPIGASVATSGFANVRRAAFGSGDVCLGALDLDALAQAPLGSDDGIRLVGDARLAASPRLLSCGKGLLRSGHERDAAGVFELTVKHYPHAPVAATAKTLWIDAEIAAAQKGRSGHLGAPTAGSAPSGTSELVVGNDSKYGLQVFLSGPRTTEFNVPACGGCADYRHQPTGYTCDSNRPSRSVELAPGSYTVEVKALDKGSVTPFTGAWSLSDGVRYDHCLFVVSTRR